MLTTLVASSGCLQKEIDVQGHGETVLTSNLSLHRFIGKLLHQNNAPVTFHIAMDAVLPSVRWRLSPVYLDVVVISLKSRPLHDETVTRVLRLLETADFTHKPKEYKSTTDILHNFGLILQPGCLHLGQYSTETVAKVKH